MNPATFQAIVENLTLASQVIDELKLQDRHTPHSFLANALLVEEVRGTNIVRVKVTLHDPQLAAEASRRLAQTAIVLARRITQQNGVSVQEQLKGYLSEAEQRVQEAERALLEYKQRAQVDLISEDTKAQLKQRGALLPLLIDIEAERARLAAAESEIKRQQPVLQTARLAADRAWGARRTRTIPGRDRHTATGPEQPVGEPRLPDARFPDRHIPRPDRRARTGAG
jgi:capsule polysaccharide export protein KpsE/RkpR